MAANDLTTIGNVKGWLNITNTNDDTLLTRLITAASSFIETYCGRDFYSQSYTETRNGKNTEIINFSNTPATAMASLYIDGVLIPQSASFGKTGWCFSPTQIYLYNHKFRKGLQNITFTYTAGYATIPLDLEQACIELISMRYKERDRIGQVSKSIGGEVIAFSQRDMPADVATILANYKKVTYQ